MSTTIEVGMATKKRTTSTTWSTTLWQLIAILRLELRKNFFNRRAMLIYVLTGMPILIMFMLATFPPTAKELSNHNKATETFAFIYQMLILSEVLFFGCAWIFMNLFRGEIIDRSLHYYFLAPVRRELLVAGKYLSGLLTAITLFVGCTAISLFLLYWPRGYAASMNDLFNGPGLSQALTYLAVTALACFGYGAVFLLVGLYFRNPIIPTAIIYGWEMINFLLPPILKKISIIYYLQSLFPVPLSEGPFALVAEPTPAWISIPGLLILTAVVLTIASYRIRKMEISYGND